MRKNREANGRSISSNAWDRLVGIVLVWLALSATSCGRADGTADSQKEAAAVQAEMNQAVQKVVAIVNQPVKVLPLDDGVEVFRISEPWFHPGAIMPEFRTVDIRKTQDLTYAKWHYVTCVLTPGVMFEGSELEFNSMTKFFYVDRSLPKKKLTEAEMVEINNLYRTIGRCQDRLLSLHAPRAIVIPQPGTGFSQQSGGFQPVGPTVSVHYGDLTLKAISGVPGRRMAMINNQTFMEGETAKVKSNDKQVEVTCKEIRVDSVVIMVDGKTQELKLGHH